MRPKINAKKKPTRRSAPDDHLLFVTPPGIGFVAVRAGQTAAGQEAVDVLTVLVGRCASWECFSIPYPGVLLGFVGLGEYSNVDSVDGAECTLFCVPPS